MSELFSSSISTFAFFAVTGSILVYLILKFDAIQRRKLKTILKSTGDVQPLFKQRSTGDKLHTLKKICSEDSSGTRSEVSKQLDKLVADYDKGQITLPDYCNQLNRLLAMVA